jgi:hypothetical protein
MPRVPARCARSPPPAPPLLAAQLRWRGRQGTPLLVWAWLATDPDRPGHRWLLIRRNRHTHDLALYRCYSPHHVPLPALVKTAGIRWTTEENFRAGKGLTGLDEHQVRRWHFRCRWTTLAMLALAFLTITAATERADHPPPDDQIPITRNEIAALFSTLVIKAVTGTRHRLRWSDWRRLHQHWAKTCHYQRQARQPLRLRSPVGVLIPLFTIAGLHTIAVRGSTVPSGAH